MNLFITPPNLTALLLLRAGCRVTLSYELHRDVAPDPTADLLLLRAEGLRRAFRGLLEDQQNDWDDYVSEQANCDSIYTSSGSDLQAIQNEMTELRAIANPDVRSAVDVRQGRGYQSSGTSSESCPADYPSTLLRFPSKLPSAARVMVVKWPTVPLYTPKSGQRACGPGLNPCPLLPRLGCRSCLATSGGVCRYRPKRASRTGR